MRGDLFTIARLKIVLLYFGMGVIIIGVAGYLTYSHFLGIVRDVVQVLQQSIMANPPVNQNILAKTLADTVDREVRSMDLWVGLWILATTLFSAYILAGYTLKPLREAMERQKRFIGNVSHELRTPLSVIKTNSEVALMSASAMTREDFIRIIQENVEQIDHMTRIAKFLLDFSNLENRFSELHLSSLDLGDLTKKAVHSMQILATQKGVSLSIIRKDSVSVRGNSTALQEMIMNLLKNAIAYTPTGGKIEITVEKGINAAELSIKDTGIGIPERDLPHIFEIFYRGDNAVDEKKDSNAGLGLAIVKEIVELHHGTINAKSELGKGTVLTIKFPNSKLGWKLRLPRITV